MFPIVFLKKMSSIVPEDTARREGSRRRSLPNRRGWAGYAPSMYLFRVYCAWSWSVDTVWASRKVLMSFEDDSVAEIEINTETDTQFVHLVE